MRDGFASAQRAYDNLIPEDFGPGFSERECDRCQMSRLADELQYDEDHNLHVCGGCLAYGDHSADGDEWRRCCEDCGELFGASLVTGKEGEDKLCKPCRNDKSWFVDPGSWPFSELDDLLNKIATGDHRWRSRMRASLEIESTDIKSPTTCPIRRSVYASLLVFALAAEERYQMKLEAEYNASK